MHDRVGHVAHRPTGLAQRVQHLPVLTRAETVALAPEVGVEAAHRPRVVAPDGKVATDEVLTLAERGGSGPRSRALYHDSSSGPIQRGGRLRHSRSTRPPAATTVSSRYTSTSRASQSGAARASSSRNATIGARAVARAALRATDRPIVSSCTARSAGTRACQSPTTVAVRSVEPLSTTTMSTVPGSSVCVATLARQLSSVAARLRVQTATVTALSVGTGSAARARLGPMGTPEENKALVLRFIDALDTGDVATVAACFDPDHYYSHAMEADLAGTWEQMKARRREPAFGDIELETVALVAEGDRVAYHTRMTATHVGELLGIPASGARVTIDSLQVWRIDGDKIVEHWGGPIVTEKVAAALRGR